jgi:exodeoxyribonuclease VII small subunit
MSGEAKPAATLESALDRIEEITRQLDRGDLELEQALALYEEGVQLLRGAEGLLNRAEQRIHQLRRVGDELHVEPLAEEP